MSHEWIFSPSSNELIQSIKSIASSNEEQNEWTRNFKRQKLSNSVTTQRKEIVADVKNNESMDPSEEIEIDVHNIIQSLENNSSNITYLLKECSKSKKFTKKIVSQLPVSCLDKICKEFLGVRHVDENHLIFFYTQFLPELFKLNQNRFILDVLEQSSKAHPLLFKDLLRQILKNTEISNDLLLGYVHNLNMEDKISFLEIAVRADLTPEEFSHNLFSIYSVYKDCAKNDTLHCDVLDMLKMSSENCRSDKNYGRFLLAYLQTQNSDISPVHMSDLHRLVERHCSPFKRLCMNILTKMSES